MWQTGEWSVVNGEYMHIRLTAQACHAFEAWHAYQGARGASCSAEKFLFVPVQVVDHSPFLLSNKKRIIKITT